MKRVLICAEGATEAVFIRDVLAPHLQQHGVFVSVRILHGIPPSWQKTAQVLHALLKDSDAVVTTMLDYYGLPASYPGMSNRPQGKPEERVKHVERAIAAEIGDERFLPFLTLHEFEALLLVDPSAVGEVVGQPKRVHCLTAAIKNTPPEEINDTAHNHPSALIRRCFPEYNKTVHGLRIAKQIGLAAIRSACPHFNEWVTALEQL